MKDIKFVNLFLLVMSWQFLALGITKPKFSAQCFERPKPKTSESGVRKGLLIEKVPSKKMGGLLVPPVIFVTRLD